MKRFLGLVAGMVLLAGMAGADEVVETITKTTTTEYVDPNPQFTESNCPKCHSKQYVIPILYGMPDEELMEQSKRGEVALGGCVIEEKAPHWHCKSCGSRW